LLFPDHTAQHFLILAYAIFKNGEWDSKSEAQVF
jgi:hypothetical protein